jgi:hypothetical protein
MPTACGVATWAAIDHATKPPAAEMPVLTVRTKDCFINGDAGDVLA